MYRPRKRNFGILYVWVAMGVGYGGWIVIRNGLTGRMRLDGAIGVMLGLFICSRAAANLLDLIMFGGGNRYVPVSRNAEYWWIVLNGLVGMLGMLVVFIGTTRFTVGM